jgi:hypothetical protein
MPEWIGHRETISREHGRRLAANYRLRTNGHWAIAPEGTGVTRQSLDPRGQNVEGRLGLPRAAFVALRCASEDPPRAGA